MDSGDFHLSLLRATLDFTEEGILVIEPRAHRILEYNQKLIELWNFPADDLRQETGQLFEYLGKQLIEGRQLHQFIEKIQTNNTASHHDLIKLNNGKIYQLRSQPLKINQQLRGQVLFFLDITEKQAQEELRAHCEVLQRKEAFLKKILSSLPSLISYVSRDYKYLYLNSTYENWWGIREKDFINRPVKDLVGEDQFKVYKPFLDLALNGQSLSFLAEVPYRAVGAKSTEINYIPHVLDNGQIEGVFVIVHDITELKKTERELGYKQQLLNQVVENIPSSLCLKNVDNNFRIELWNRAAETLFGIPRENILGKLASDFWPKEATDRQAQLEQKLIQEGKTSEFSEVTGHTIDQKELHLKIAHIPICAPGTDKVQHILNVCTDMTKERESQRILIQTAKMSSLGEMASGMAHEINNPLTIIQFIAESMRNHLMKGGSSPAVFLEMISKIEKHSKRIAKIVKSLQSFSRNSETDPMQIVNFKQVFDDAMELCLERFKFQKIDVRVDIDPKVRIACRPSQISQVIMNLLNNAFDAVLPLPEKWVEVQTIRDGEALSVLVTDSGSGISTQFQDKIMQPFFTTKEVGKGTGLGLSISKGIAEAHQGTLSYDATSPHTRFILKLPLKMGASLLCATRHPPLP